MRKNILVLSFLISSLSTHAQFTGFDIYSNPQLTEPSLATTFANKLRNTNINDMEKLIDGECRQFKDYVHLSINNWDLAKFKYKSLNEAEQYSQQLISQIPYQQSQQYTFPFGIRTYLQSEQILRKAVFERTEPLKQDDLVNDMYFTCLQMNSQKYFIILSSNSYLKNNQSIFLSESELIQKMDTSNSLLEINKILNKEDKLTPAHVAEKINFTEKDFLVANILIDEDIKNSFYAGSINWVNYKKVSYDMQNNFKKFMEKGGRNQKFAMIASIVKYQSLKTENFNNIEVRNTANLNNIFNFNKNELSEQKFKNIMKNFNY